MKTYRDFDYLELKQNPYTCYYEAEYTFGIKGQKCLTPKQLEVIKKLYNNWGDWRVRLAVWLIGKTSKL